MDVKRCQDRMDGKIKSGASLDRCLCNHAEANAIMHCAILGIGAGTKDAILYSTFVPCLECSKMAITIGIKEIICLDTYPETDYDLIKESGVTIKLLDKDKIQYWTKTLLKFVKCQVNRKKNKVEKMSHGLLISATYRNQKAVLKFYDPRI